MEIAADGSVVNEGVACSESFNGHEDTEASDVCPAPTADQDTEASDVCPTPTFQCSSTDAPTFVALPVFIQAEYFGRSCQYGSYDCWQLGSYPDGSHNWSYDQSYQNAYERRRPRKTRSNRYEEARRLEHACVPRRINLEEKSKENDAEPKTTIMIRNIPNDYTKTELMQELNDMGFENLYDFFYLPVDCSTGCNVGYCFVNFERAEDAVDAMLHLQAYEFHFSTCSRKRVAKVSYAHLQGLERNIAHVKTKVVDGSPSFRPWVKSARARKDNPHLQDYQTHQNSLTFDEGGFCCEVGFVQQVPYQAVSSLALQGESEGVESHVARTASSCDLLGANKPSGYSSQCTGRPDDLLLKTSSMAPTDCTFGCFYLLQPFPPLPVTEQSLRPFDHQQDEGCVDHVQNGDIALTPAEVPSGFLLEESCSAPFSENGLCSSGSSVVGFQADTENWDQIDDGSDTSACKSDGTSMPTTAPWPPSASSSSSLSSPRRPRWHEYETDDEDMWLSV